MRRKASWAHAAAIVAVLFILAGVPALAQQSPIIPDSSAEINDLLRKGQQMEIESRWGDALSHYEDAVRSYPGQTNLKRRYEFARLHYDLGRRYADKSFVSSVSTMTLAEALDLYSEVLLKLQTHYVDAPNFKDLVEQGLNNFEIALGEPAFVSNNLPNADAAALLAFRQELRRVLGPRVIRDRTDARENVRMAAQLAERRLALVPTAVVLEFLCGATNTRDAYSAYLSPNQLDEVYSQIEGNFVGLGIELKAADGALLIVRVIPRSPAEEAGIVAGDRITAVDGRPTRDMTTDQAANLLQGPAESTVRLTLDSPNRPQRTITAQRRRVEVPSIDSVHIVDSEFGIGYLRLTCFEKTTSRDLDAALWDLHRAGMKTLIMDLRGNPGGLLVSAVEVVDKFVERGLIVSTRGRSLQEDFTYSAHVPGTWRVPLVVLIDKDSASAAEIFAGAIRDHARGTIVGQRSYGKGSVQGIFPLNQSGAGVRLTTAKFYSPSGHPYNGIGVQPEVTVHQVAKPIDGDAAPATGDDAALATALQAARQLVGRRQ